MTETVQTPVAAAEAIAAEMKAPNKFNFAAAINQTSFPTGKVSIFLDGDTAGKMLETTEQIADLEALAATQAAGSNGGITDDPELTHTNTRIAELTATQAVLAETVLASKITFHMRGVVPSVWRAIDKKARATVKPASKADEDVLEANMTRNMQVNNELVAHAVTSVENAAGEVDDSGLDAATVAHLFDTLHEAEWFKILGKMQELTFANELFAKATEQDADFLPQP